MTTRRPRGGQSGVALLMVVTVVAILSVVVVEFSGTSRTHLDQGVNLRDQTRATTLADTALVLTRACLDPEAWGPLASFQERLGLEKLCNLMLGIMVRGRVDLPIAGLSVELDKMQGMGVDLGDVDEIQLTSEEAFIGLGGLSCPPGQELGRGCPTRRLAIDGLRALLCDPAVAHVFEREQEDGQRYTREDVIGNLIDWVDPDDKRVAFDQSFNLVDGIGEGEDAYYRRLDDPYRTKNAPFDSIEELRLVRGINDDLFEHLRTRVSVQGTGKINVNQASAEVLSALLWTRSPAAMSAENQFCGKDVEGMEQARAAFLQYAKLLVLVRQARVGMNFLALPYRPPQGARMFVQDVRDPMAALTGAAPPFGVAGMPEELLFPALGFGSRQVYEAVRLAVMGDPQAGGGLAGLEGSVTTESKFYRLQASGTVGNMSRHLFAILKKDGPVIRTVYYREE